MRFFDGITGVKFTKTGADAKAAIESRLSELQRRLDRRNAELEIFMDNKQTLRSYLVRSTTNDHWRFGGGQMHVEMPSEEHQRVTELCLRINAIEEEIASLKLVHYNLQDEQTLELNFENLKKLGFGEPEPSGF
jgi:hypothetical protein